MVINKILLHAYSLLTGVSASYSGKEIKAFYLPRKSQLLGYWYVCIDN